MRAGEIRSLVKKTIHLKKKFVTLPETKNGSQRDVPLSAVAIQILEGLDPNEPFPIGAGTLDVTFRRLRKKAGVDDVHFHDARAEAITRLAKKLDIHDLARMSGHKDLKMLLVYYRATASEIAGRL